MAVTLRVGLWCWVTASSEAGMRRIGLAILLLLVVCSEGSVGAQSSPDLAALDEILERASLALRTDLELVVLHGDAVVYRHKSQGHGGVGELAIASASKWLAAAVIQSLVDEGLLSWDDPVGLHLFYFGKDKAEITLRQLLSHTSGSRGDFECLNDRTKTMDACVQTISREPLLHQPGTTFQYGDPAFQVGGRVAETVSKRFWESLFQERIAIPSGMRFTTFQPDGPTVNPDVAAGAVSTTDDYIEFLRMLMRRGVRNERSVLSRRGVDQMLADQTRGAWVASSNTTVVGAAPAGGVQARYGLGNWLEGVSDGVSDANSSQGGFGVSPYLDRRREMAFLLFLRDASGEFNRYYLEIRDTLAAAFPLAEVTVKSEFREHGAPGGLSQRKAYSYTPARCAEQGAQCPALVVFPPNGKDAREFAGNAALTTLAEREELILLLWDQSEAAADNPSGQELGRNLAPDFGAALPNDTRLAADSLALLSPMPGVDSQRIYLLGVEEGADLAALAACRYADSFAAVGLVSPGITLAPYGDEDTLHRICLPQAQVPMLVWGFGMPVAPELLTMADATPARQQARFWAEQNDCQAESEGSWRREQTLWTVTSWAACRSGVSVQLVEGELGVESWPAEGAEIVWEFLRGYAARVRVRGAAVLTNAASYERRRTSPGALATLFGADLAGETSVATGAVLPTMLGGIRVEVRDRTGITQDAPLIFVSPEQINFQVPEGLVPGMASVFVYRGLDLTHLDWLYVDASAPGLFSADASGEGAAAGEALYVLPNGVRLTFPLGSPSDDAGVMRLSPVYLGEPNAELYLTVYGTGWRNNSTESVSVWLGGVRLPPEFAGRQGFFQGLDQVNVRLDLLPQTVKDGFSGKTVPLTICSPQGCSNRVGVRFEAGAHRRP